MRPLPSTGVAVAALSLLLTGCGGDQQNVATAVADDLAIRADAVAEALAQGDGCLALERTSQLQSATAGARDAGEVPDDVAAEILAATRRITDATACEPPAREQDDEDHDAEDEDRGRDDDEHEHEDGDDDDGGGPGRGRGKGHGKDKGGGDD